MKLRNIIDTWNMIEKFDISDYETENETITISKADYQKIYDGSRNKKYVKSLLV